MSCHLIEKICKETDKEPRLARSREKSHSFFWFAIAWQSLQARQLAVLLEQGGESPKEAIENSFLCSLEIVALCGAGGITLLRMIDLRGRALSLLWGHCGRDGKGPISGSKPVESKIWLHRGSKRDLPSPTRG